MSSARPIISTIEVLLGLDSRAIAANSGMVGMSGFKRGLLKLIVRIACQIVFVVIAIALPSFDRIMTLMGAVACFSICIIIPLAVHLKLFGSQIGKAEKVMNWALIIVSTIMAVVSTVFAVLPKEMIGAA
jgi:solute carrier family 32 (vesicular inhibitory amino acid transporter)